ncbi:MAG: DoxX family protein [Terracidiphilus sp.]|nr:DoxX family protein [Terracidiphilus sp.]
MNTLLWTAQILLAAIFLFTGFTKLIAYERSVRKVESRSNGLPAGVSRGLAAFIGLAEIAGALGLVVPTPLAPGYLLVLAAASGLALIMVFAGIYHLRRQEEAAPAVVLFLLALFVIVGRWPR